jgi:hypothetical protein
LMKMEEIANERDVQLTDSVTEIFNSRRFWRMSLQVRIETGLISQHYIAGSPFHGSCWFPLGISRFHAYQGWYYLIYTPVLLNSNNPPPSSQQTFLAGKGSFI